jgi:hypothetical protein
MCDKNSHCCLLLSSDFRLLITSKNRSNTGKTLMCELPLTRMIHYGRTRYHHSPAVCQGKRPRNHNSFPALELTHVPSPLVFPPWLQCRSVTKLLHWVAGAVLMGRNPESIRLCHHKGSLHIFLLHLRYKAHQIHYLTSGKIQLRQCNIQLVYNPQSSDNQS